MYNSLYALYATIYEKLGKNTLHHKTLTFLSTSRHTQKCIYNVLRVPQGIKEKQIEEEKQNWDHKTLTFLCKSLQEMLNNLSETNFF